MPSRTTTSRQSRPHVVIVGAGFGGLYAARALADAPVRITLIDRTNHHTFQPLLYEVATAALSGPDVAAPVRGIFSRDRNVEVLLAEVIDFDLDAGQVILADGAIDYDWLILAAGSTFSYFGHDEWAPLAPGLKTINDAMEIRRRFLLAFESAEREADADARARELTFIIVGAGPTGVELAGTMSEIACRSIARDFRALDPCRARVVLVEALDRVLPTYPPDLSQRAQRDLERLGVEVRLGAPVTEITPDGARVGDEFIAAGNVFWAAGVKASPLGARLGVETAKAGRVPVQPDLTVDGRSNVFIIGDLAIVRDAQTGEDVPAIAPAAIQMGRYAARTIADEVTGRRAPGQREPFHYRDRGQLATIGRAKAVGIAFGRHVAGLVAWLIWALVHIFYLIGFRNRLIVMLRWAWAYLVFQRGARIITGESSVQLSRPRQGHTPDGHARERESSTDPAAAAAEERA